jgi:molybdopterin molybdotransferase
MFAAMPWLGVCFHRHVADDLDATRAALNQALAACDAVVMTGGVSIGPRDFARVAVKQVGARTVFHRLPIRPGRPILGAIAPGGKPIIGLPGNPVSTLVTARRFAPIVLRRLAGCAVIDPPPAMVQVDRQGFADRTLWLYLPVVFGGAGKVSILPSNGSGDAVAAGRAAGFIEVAPATQGRSLRAFYPWEL